MSRKFNLLLLLFFAAAQTSLAQERTVYSPVLDLGENTSSHLRFVERYSGSKLAGAELDLCFGYNVDNANGIVILGDFDRVVVPLQLEGGNFTGTATSNEGKRLVQVRLQKRGSDKAVFSGTVSIAGKSFDVSGEPVFGQPAAEETPLLTVVSKTEVFDESASPNTVAVKFKRGNQAQVLEFLRPLNVKVDLASAALDRCAVLRSGEEHLRIMAPPSDVPALIANLKKLPFVIEAGWTASFAASPSVRVADARWIRKGVLDNQKVADELSTAIAKHLGASISGISWDERSGELVVTFKRPSQLFPNLGLTENLRMVVLVGPQQPGETDLALLWSPTISGDVHDERQGHRLSLIPLTLFAGPPEGIVVNIEPEVLARLVKGEWLDPATNAWMKR